MKYTYNIYKPSGNDTALVLGLVSNNDLRKRINQKIQKQHPNVEQVGFVEKIRNEYFLEMAGGEFCGNSTRSAVHYFLGGEVGELEIKVSGVSRLLKAGINIDRTVWIEMPINQSLEKVSILKGYSIVEMEGITHVVLEVSDIKTDKEEVKKDAFNILESLDLTEKGPACGVMYLTQTYDGYSIDPIVWVKDLNTLYYETACGSGTTAVGLYESKKKGVSLFLSITQPSGLSIGIEVQRDREKFLNATIRGEVQILDRELEIEV
jgi:histidine racemase